MRVWVRVRVRVRNVNTTHMCSLWCSMILYSMSGLWRVRVRVRVRARNVNRPHVFLVVFHDLVLDVWFVQGVGEGEGVGKGEGYECKQNSHVPCGVP